MLVVEYHSAVGDTPSAASAVVEVTVGDRTNREPGEREVSIGPVKLADDEAKISPPQTAFATPIPPAVIIDPVDAEVDEVEAPAVKAVLLIVATGVFAQ